MGLRTNRRPSSQNARRIQVGHATEVLYGQGCWRRVANTQHERRLSRQGSPPPGVWCYPRRPVWPRVLGHRSMLAHSEQTDSGYVDRSALTAIGESPLSRPRR
jgi:hypothetical protein